jgi:hypothetical protein
MNQPARNKSMKQTPRHQCLIYGGSPTLHLASTSAALKQKLQQKSRCLYLNSAPMVAGMRSYLAAAGVDVVREIEERNLVLSSEQAHLVEGRFDVDTMITSLEAAVEQAIDDGYRGLWATGDMSWEFGPQKDFSKLVEYERRLEELFQKTPFLSGVCQYHTDSLPRDAVRDGLTVHPAIFINETLSCLNPHYQTAG